MKKGTANKKEANGSHFGGKICYFEQRFLLLLHHNIQYIGAGSHF